jgi:hypothetical protein
MSLPACEQRVLKNMEGALRVSEPHLAAMYAIFARLNAGEPVGAESLARGRVPRPRAAVCAMVLIPVMFAIVVVGALLSGSARGATSCATSSPAVRGGPMLSRASCPPSPRGVLERLQDDHTSLGMSCRSSSLGTKPRSC